MGRALGRSRLQFCAPIRVGEQISGVQFLEGWGHFAEKVLGPIHRRSNDANLCFAAAGLMTRKRLNCGVYNIKFGPFHKCANRGLFQDAASEMADAVLPDDAPLVVLLSASCRDRGEGGRSTRTTLLLHDPTYCAAWPRRSS